MGPEGSTPRDPEAAVAHPAREPARTAADVEDGSTILQGGEELQEQFTLDLIDESPVRGLKPVVVRIDDRGSLEG